MNNQKLARGIAALLPHCGETFIGESLIDEGSINYQALAFKCHRALARKYDWCKCDEDKYLYGEMESVEYSGDYFRAVVNGVGRTDEDAIFAAVIDWMDKGGVV